MSLKKIGKFSAGVKKLGRFTYVILFFKFIELINILTRVKKYSKKMSIKSTPDLFYILRMTWINLTFHSIFRFVISTAFESFANMAQIQTVRREAISPLYTC